MIRWLKKKLEPKIRSEELKRLLMQLDAEYLQIRQEELQRNALATGMLCGWFDYTKDITERNAESFLRCYIKRNKGKRDD